MKNILLILLFAGSFMAVNAQGLEDIIVERYYVSNADDSVGSIGTLPVGSVTYRIFVDMAPGYKFQMLYGDTDHDMLFETTTTFFNNEDRGAKTPTYTKTQAKLNTVMLDSWVTVGAACAGNFGVLKSEDDGVATVVNSDGILQNNNPLAGIPISQQDGLLAGTPESITILGIQSELEVFNDVSLFGGQLYSTNGTWASLYGSKGPTPTNQVLVAQITTKGVFNFRFNIQIQDTATFTTYKYVHSSPLPDEIMFPGLTYSSNLPPNISITSPASGGAFIQGNTVTVNADASDFDGTVSKVRFYVDGTMISEDLNAPYSANYTAVYGNHTLIAKAYDDMNDSTASSPVAIGVGVTDVKEIQNNPAVNIFPNPVTGTLTVKVNPTQKADSDEAVITLTDLNGRMIMSKKVHVNMDEFVVQFDMSVLPAGQYLVQTILGSFRHSQPVNRN